jgi:hypothetical protein
MALIPIQTILNTITQIQFAPYASKPFTPNTVYVATDECQWCLGIGCQMCDGTIKNITVQSGGPGPETNVIVEVWGNSRCDCAVPDPCYGAK